MVPSININKTLRKMKKLTNQYALIEYQKAVLENYNPSVVLESDDIEYLENLEFSDYVDEGPTAGCTIVEKREDGIYDYFTGEKFNMEIY
ncbi:MAG: hypothetical protein ACOCVF_03125 [bacterium]